MLQDLVQNLANKRYNIDMKDTMKHYYKVALSLDSTWKKNIYLYHYESELELGSVVYAPFGKTKKLGFVVEFSEQSQIKTKSLELIDQPMVLPDEALEFFDWLKNYYPNTPGNHVQHLLPSYVTKNIKTKSEQPGQDKLIKQIDLNKEQKIVVKEIRSNNRPQILHGITGAGKTRVMCELAKLVTQEQKNVLIIYPEISLTSQIYNSLIEFFGSDKIHTIHSRMNIGQKRKAWTDVLNSKSGSITIGPRSALFLPHQNLGLVVVDEAHDPAYKSDSGSRYNGVLVAGGLSIVHEAKLVISSATPPVSEVEHIIKKGGSISCLHNLAISESNSNRTFEIVDMRDKKLASERSYLLSKTLIKNVEESLNNRRQSLLFLNRRGTAKLLLCENCGWHAECTKCDMPMTFHHDNFELRCHICGNKQPTAKNCPECSGFLSQRGAGTKAIEIELKKIFPQAKIMRFDSDNNKSESFNEQYENIIKGEVDILLGTQLITKGLDLPNLETVGILQAESALFMPDFVSEERSFQQLTQVSGRVGRGHIDGRVIIQSYNPENKIFDYVKKQDWHRFRQDELSKRQKSNYPPYSYVMKVWVNKPIDRQAINTMTKFSKEIEKDKSLHILGPAPSFYSKVGGNFSWQLVIKSSSRKKLAAIAESLPKDFMFDLDPVSLL
jgi:primosomal protein N' (replication factor Y)